MPLSEYKVDAFLNEFRKRFGYKRTPTHQVDALKISAEAQYEAHRLQTYLPQSTPLSEWVTPQTILSLIADPTPYDAIKEYEQQRRAGMFLEPTYIPPNPPPNINLVQDHLGEFRAISTMGASSEAHTQDPVDAAGTPQPSSRATPVTTATGASQHSPQPEQEAAGLDTFSEEDFVLEDDFVLEEEDERSGSDSDVVYGLGRVTDESMVEFVHKYPDSAIKYLARRSLDGKPLPSEVEGLYDSWQKRGLSRKKLRAYILAIMEWDTLPDSTLMDMWSELRDRIYELTH